MVNGLTRNQWNTPVVPFFWARSFKMFENFFFSWRRRRKTTTFFGPFDMEPPAGGGGLFLFFFRLVTPRIPPPEQTPAPCILTDSRLFPIYSSDSAPFPPFFFVLQFHSEQQHFLSFFKKNYLKNMKNCR